MSPLSWRRGGFLRDDRSEGLGPLADAEDAPEIRRRRGRVGNSQYLLVAAAQLLEETIEERLEFVIRH